MASWTAVFLSLAFVLEGVSGLRVMCVYQNWAQYRTDQGRFLPDDVDPTLCTHIIYVYAKLQNNKVVPAEWNDEGNSWSEGMFDRVQNLKQINPELKTLLGVGGWTAGSKEFSRVAGRPGSRRVFAVNAVSYLRERHFDGLAIDWQYPTRRGGRPHDKKNFSFLLKELRRAIEEDSKKSGLPKLLLSIGVSASRETIDKAYEIQNITRYTDFINVLAYDLHGAWDNYTGHPSQLYPRKEEFGPSTEVNVDAVMRYWMSKVSDRSKLNLGVSSYGRTFTLRKARHNDYNVPTKGPGLAGDYTKEPGMLAYYERCSQYAGATRVWDDASKVAYWYQGDQWTAGEDVESIKAKVRWVKGHSIGGLALRSLDTDDFFDTCSNGTYPLLNAIQEEKQAPFVPTTPPATTTTDSTTTTSSAHSSARTTSAKPPSTRMITKPSKGKQAKSPKKTITLPKKTETVARTNIQVTKINDSAKKQDKDIEKEPIDKRLSKTSGPASKGKKRFPSRNENPNKTQKASSKAIRQGNRIIIRRKKVMRKPKNRKTPGNNSPKPNQKPPKGEEKANVKDGIDSKSINNMNAITTNSESRNAKKTTSTSRNANVIKETDSVSSDNTKSNQQPRAEPLIGDNIVRQQPQVIVKDNKTIDKINGKKSKSVKKISEVANKDSKAKDNLSINGKSKSVTKKSEVTIKASKAKDNSNKNGKTKSVTKQSESANNDSKANDNSNINGKSKSVTKISEVVTNDSNAKDNSNVNGKKAEPVKKKVPAKRKRGRKVIRRKLTKKQIQMLRERRRQKQRQMKNKAKKTTENKSV